MVNIINKINSKVNGLSLVSNRLDSSKVALNNQVNNLPSAQSVTSQEQIEALPTKSTIGLLGFEGDAGSLIDRSLKGQVIPASDLENKAFNDQFGVLQVDTQSDGVVQSKDVKFDGTMLKTFDQRKIAAASQAQRQKLEVFLSKLRGNNQIAIQKASSDEFTNAFGGKDNKRVIESSSGIRLFIDGLNNSINEKMSKIRNKKKETVSNVSNVKSESPVNGTGKDILTSIEGIDLSRVA